MFLPFDRRLTHLFLHFFKHCFDPNASIQELLQAYVWRRDIEVNFRDEKILLGIGRLRCDKSIPWQMCPLSLSPHTPCSLQPPPKPMDQPANTIHYPARNGHGIRRFVLPHNPSSNTSRHEVWVQAVSPASHHNTLQTRNRRNSIQPSKALCSMPLRKPTGAKLQCSACRPVPFKTVPADQI